MNHSISPLEEPPRVVLPGKTKRIHRPAVEVVDFHEISGFHKSVRGSNLSLLQCTNVPALGKLTARLRGFKPCGEQIEFNKTLARLKELSRDQHAFLNLTFIVILL